MSALERAEALRGFRERASAAYRWDHALWDTRPAFVAALSPSGLEGARQAKDVPTDVLLDVVRALARPYWATRWDVADALGVNEKVVLAKLRKAKKQGLVAGCFCGCRGDIELVER